jgi:ribosomal-protein-alanine N-acetyltransferase
MAREDDPPGLLIQPAGSADAAVMAALHGACFPEQPWDRAAIEALMRPSRAFALLASISGHPAGFCLARDAADEAEILSLCVLPEQRRHGIGRRLLEAAMTEARRRRCRALYLEAAVDNQAALALYRRLGFEVLGRRRGYYARRDGKATDAMILCLRFAK